MGKQPVYSRIAAKHVNVMDRVVEVRPRPINTLAIAALFREFGAQHFVVRKVA